MRKLFAVTLSLLIMLTAAVNTAADGVVGDKTQNTVAESENDAAALTVNADSYTDIGDSDVVKNADGSITVSNSGGYITYSFYAEKDGVYVPFFNYCAPEGNGNDIEIGLKIDGEYPSGEFENLMFPRLWKNASDTFSADSNGNEYPPEQVEVHTWQKKAATDRNGFINGALAVHIPAGRHTLIVLPGDETFQLKSIEFFEKEKTPLYKEVQNAYKNKGFKNYNGKEIVAEGESAVYKSKRSLGPLSSRSDPSVQPSDAYKAKINYIGGSNWSQTGDTIYWNVEAPQSALYRISFRFHQTYIQEGAAYRSLTVDGKIPFEEAESIAFGYKSGWQSKTLGDENGDMLLYLEKGNHIISLSVTLGKMAELAGNLQSLTAEMGKIYREIVMITGETPDANRDYNLFSAIPDLETRLTEISEKLKKYAADSETVYGMKGGSSAQILRKAAVTIDQMLKVKYKAQTKKSAYYDNFASLSSWVYEIQNMALDIDCIVLSSPDRAVGRGGVSHLKKFGYTTKRLVSSFIDDYDSFESDNNSITVWTTYGRDQVNVVNSLIDGDFTPKTGIRVNLKITEASLIQARLSGKAPDAELAVANNAPVDYGMRGALYNLKNFDDYETVLKRFQRNAAVPYCYKDALYGLPVTQSFPMMFVRTDILKEENIEIPRTWDELLLTAKILAMNNMQVGLAENAAGGTGYLAMFALQNGITFYNDNLTASNFSTSSMQSVVKIWTDFYTKYNFPKTYSFYNRFKIGLIPIAIIDYTQYSTISAAAREITGRWKMIPVPGTMGKDGAVNNSVCGSGSAAVILSSTEKPKQAWEFLKWWTSEDIQYRYATGIESVLGVSARVATANISAALRLGYNSETVDSLKNQLEKVESMPVIPGSYYIDRVVMQLFNNIVNGGQNIKQSLDKWGEEFDNEIKRKTEEYA